MRPHTTITAGLTALLAITACGGNDTDTEPDTQDSPSPQVTDTPTPADEPTEDDTQEPAVGNTDDEPHDDWDLQAQEHVDELFEWIRSVYNADCSGDTLNDECFEAYAAGEDTLDEFSGWLSETASEHPDYVPINYGQRANLAQDAFIDFGYACPDGQHCESLRLGIITDVNWLIEEARAW